MHLLDRCQVPVRYLSIGCRLVILIGAWDDHIHLRIVETLGIGNLHPPAGGAFGLVKDQVGLPLPKGAAIAVKIGMLTRMVVHAF